LVAHAAEQQRGNKPPDQRAAAREQEEYDRPVTDWEVSRGFERG